MYLDYDVGKLFRLLLDSIINYKIFIFLLVSVVLYIILYLLNNNKFKMFCILVNTFISIIIICFYHSNLFNLEIFKHFNHNMYFYYLNSIVYLNLINVLSYKNELNMFNLIIYGFSLILLLFALFMTKYLNNVDIIVLGNIYPSIVIGNTIYSISYIILIIKKIKILICK